MCRCKFAEAVASQLQSFATADGDPSDRRRGIDATRRADEVPGCGRAKLAIAKRLHTSALLQQSFNLIQFQQSFNGSKPINIDAIQHLPYLIKRFCMRIEYGELHFGGR